MSDRKVLLLPAKFRLGIRISHLPGDRGRGLSCLRKQSLRLGMCAGGLFEVIPGNEAEPGRVKQGRRESPSEGAMWSWSAPRTTRLSHGATSEELREADLGLPAWGQDKGAAIHRLLLVQGPPCASRFAQHKCGVTEVPEREASDGHGCSSGRLLPGDDGRRKR